MTLLGHMNGNHLITMFSVVTEGLFRDLISIIRTSVFCSTVLIMLDVSIFVIFGFSPGSRRSSPHLSRQSTQDYE